MIIILSSESIFFSSLCDWVCVGRAQAALRAPASTASGHCMPEPFFFVAAATQDLPESPPS